MKDINSNALRQMISKTVASRFQASRRLTLHNNLSLFSITLFSILLILVSMVQAVGLKFAVSDYVVNIGQLFLSILVLCFSIAITMSDFSLKSSKQHDCGMELNELVTYLKNKWDIELSDDEYNDSVKKYYSILAKYENHLDVDFNKVVAPKKICSKENLNYYARFGFYYVLLLTVLTWIYYLGVPPALLSVS
ncbi:SLATT domain-containing protein [Pseudomonas sp. IT-P294]|uniref:SLATT domain-containing protein n=1 Tax=Pseudomonas sp. IT-P294 TaxID=3026454 RepID=UPI0039E066C2